MEQQYEYGVVAEQRYPGGWSEVVWDADDCEDAESTVRLWADTPGYRNVRIVRRPVGEWEDVPDGE